MASGDSLVDWHPWDNVFPDWQTALFHSGSVEPSIGDTIYGDTSAANARLEYLGPLVFGSWGGGNAAGSMLLSNWNGSAWTSGEAWDTTDSPGGFDDGQWAGGTVPVNAVTATRRRNDKPATIFRGGTVIASVGIFGGILPSWYAGGGITARIAWSSETATTNNVDWWGAFKSFTDDTDNIDTALFAAAKSATGTATASVSGEVKYTDIAFLNSEIAGLAVGEYFQFLLMRDDNASTDSGTDDAEVRSVELRET